MSLAHHAGWANTPNRGLAHASGWRRKQKARDSKVFARLRARDQKADTGKALLRATRTAGVSASRSSKVK